MKKILAILLAGVMTATAFAGCGSASSAPADESSAGGDESSATTEGAGLAELDAEGFVDVAELGDEDNVELKVWTPDDSVKLTQELCDAFVAHYADKSIKINVVAQGEDTAATQAQSDIEAAADVFGFASDQLDNLINAGIIAQCAYPENVTEMNSAESVAAGTVDDIIYYYPETTNGYFLVYDKSVVSDEQAGKLEDVLAACKKAGKKFIFNCGDGYYACAFLFTGGVAFDGYTDETQETQAFNEYDEDEAVATLQAFARLMKEYKGTFTSLSVDKIYSGFSDGSCGAGVDGTWDIATDKKALGDNYGAAKLPTINVNGEDKQIVSVYGYKAIGVKSTTEYPLTAAALALYLTGENAQRQRVETLGWGPTNVVVSAEDLVTSDPALAASVEQAKNALPQVHILTSSWAPMGTLGDKLNADEWDPEDTEATKKLFEQTIANIKDE